MNKVNKQVCNENSAWNDGTTSDISVWIGGLVDSRSGKCFTRRRLINDALLTINIEKFYEAVVKFIKEYNKFNRERK